MLKFAHYSSTSVCVLLAHDFSEYIEEHPGSIYARDYAVKPQDVQNKKATVVLNRHQYDKDQVGVRERAVRWHILIAMISCNSTLLPAETDVRDICFSN